MNNEKEPKLTTGKMIVLIAMELIVIMLNILNLCTKFCKLYEVKHYVNIEALRHKARKTGTIYPE